MKSKFKYWLIAFLAVVAITSVAFTVAPAPSAYADDVNITCATASGNYLNEDYLAVYRVPTSMLTYESSGGALSNNPISNAFDGNWNSYWQTNTENSGQNTNNPSFLNAITVTFSQAVTIESIVYASSTARLGHGYPITLNLYTANGGDLSLYGTCNSAATNDRVVFTLKEAVTVTKIKFEFRQVNTMHNWTATAKEICFMQPDNASANKVIDLFSDYAQLNVKDEYKASLTEIRNNVKNLISYESALKPLLDRAEAIVSGQITKDSRREFSTDPNAENVITQYGDLRSYAGNTLKMSSFGINRQVLGIGGLMGDTITIYVEANAGDPLPTIAFTQVYGDWRSWQSSYRLSLGKNVLTFPNFITDNYTRQTVAGGTIHLINAYEPSQQSSNVKIYIEGGFLYPVFRKGGDVDAFRNDVTAYYNQMQNTSGMCDVTEMVCDHVIQTFSATTAYNNYVVNNVNPQKSAEGWDGYMRALLEFAGVSFNPTDKYYNVKNEHLYTNFRMVQPWAGAFAFAAGDHIGFIDINQSTLANYSNNLGWGFAHEVGHALDVNGRTIGETTNNMWAKFATAYFENNVGRNFNAVTTNTLTPDETALSAELFNSNRYNYQIWWNLEAVHHGFWGQLDNMYRFYDETAARNNAGVTAEDGQLSADERMVYFSSIVMGEDLGYYYERFSFTFSSGDSYAPFRKATASSAYKKLMAKALQDGVIEEKNFKYWYIDADQYYYDVFNGSCYNSSSSVEIRDVWKTSSGYMLLLPESDGSAQHLGYEIMEYRNGSWYVIGFTYSGSYVDTTSYPSGYTPQYKIRAYDRGMGVSAESAAVTFTELHQSKVCRIGDVYYNSLAEAVEAANAGDTIYICANMYDGAITVNKNLTILPDPSISESVVITKNAIGAIITVSGGATLTLGSNDGAKIVFDGNSFTQEGSLIRVIGSTLRVYNAELRNNRNTDHGGAVYNTGNSAFTNVTFKDNTTRINGGAIANFSGGVLTLTDCTFSGNKAKGNGGAITADGRTALINTTVTNNTASNVGGAIFMSCSNNARTVSFEGCVIRDNVAENVGSLIYIEKGIFVLGNADNTLSGEVYKVGGAINVSAEAPNLSSVTFRVPNVSEGAVLLTATGSATFSNEFAASLKVELADAYLGDGSKTILLKPWPTVTFNVNGMVVTQQIAMGNFVLPDTVQGLDESKYIIAWEYNGSVYAAGATVEITGDCSFAVSVLGDKFTVTFKYDENNSKVHYVKPNGILVLDECGAPYGKAFSHWDVNGAAYQAGDTITVKGDMVITAVFVDLVTEGVDDGSQPDNTVLIICLVVIGVLIVVGAAVAVVIVLKRKKSAKK